MEDSQFGNNPSADSSSKVLSGKKNFYDILKIKTNATPQEISGAYFKIKAIFQEDNQAFYSMFDQVSVSQRSKEVEEAYKTLSNPLKRQFYDKNMMMSGTSLEKESSSPVEYPSDITAFSYHRLEGFSYGFPEEKSRHILDIIPRRFTAKKADSQELTERAKEIVEAYNTNKDGFVFKQLRELFEVDKSEIQDYTKISLEHINHIENNDFKNLPHSIYVRGFLKSYLNYLGIKNPLQIVDIFIARLESCSKEKTF